MANKGLAMDKILEIKRLRELGHTQTKISQLLGLNRKTIIKYWEVKDFKNPSQQAPVWFKNLNQEYLLSEIRNGVSKKLLHEELNHEFNLPTYQAFSHFLKKHLEETKEPKISLKQSRVPGDSTEVDYSGNSIPVLIPSTGELQKTEMFVGALSYSSYIYAEFTYSQRLEDFLRSHVNMFKYFGGVSRFVVVDNLKSGVTKSDVFEPDLNKSFHDLCTHYGIAIDPARVFHPKDKPVVENAVGLIQKDFFQRVRKKTYTSIHSLNQDLWNFLKFKNNQIMKERGESRKFFFNKELKFLSPLPKYDYEIFYYKKAKVHPDCHIQHDKNFYSVPYKYVGKEITVKYNSKLVHIFSGAEVLAIHKARKGRNQRSTRSEHYPEKQIVEMNYLVQSLCKKSGLIGVQTKNFIDRLLKEPKHPLKNLRKSQSILAFEKKFSKEALEDACGKALLFEKLSYYYIKSCCESYNLKSNKNKVKQKAPKRAKNLICLEGGTQ